MISNKLMNEIGKMDVTDLIELNHQVVSIIKHKRNHEAVSKSLTFKVGDKVVFVSRRTGRKVGEIVKCNPRKAIVAVKNPYTPSEPTVKWNVPYSMLTKVS